MKKTIKIVFLAIFAIGILSICNKVHAASATISANKTTATVGDAVTITVKYNAAAWSLSVSGDGVSSNKYVGNTDDAKNAGATKTITLDTSSAGTKTISLTGDVTDGDTDATTKINTSVKVTINPKSNPSGGPSDNSGGSSGDNAQAKATITKLVIAGKTYKNPAKSITVKVDNDVTTAKISVTTSNGETYKIDKGSSVKLEEGTNTVKITLASGNVYTVYIQRLAKEDNTPNIIDEEVKVLLKSLKIEGFSLDPEFTSEVYEYRLTLNEEHNDLTKLNIEAIANQEDFTVEIKGNEELKEGENVIEIIVKSKEGDKTTTYKIIVDKLAKTMPISSEVELLNEPQEIIKPLWSPTQKILITIFTSIIALMGIWYAVIEYRYGKEKKQEEMGEIPFAKIGFENEDTQKQDLLNEEEEKQDKEEIKIEKKMRKKNIEEQDEKTKSRGKHF